MANKKKTKIGVVLSNKMEKTVVVQVSRKVEHPLFHRFFNRRKKYKVHDEKKQCQVGDRVLIQETIPMSRDKRWIISEVLSKGSGV